MKEAYYFSHDYNARNDPKVMAMRKDYKSEGYGWFWIIVETLAEQQNYKLRLNKVTYNALAMTMLCETNAVEQFINDCISEYELFESDNKYFWSNSLLRRMEIKEEKRKKKSEAGKKGANARWGAEESSKSDDNDMAVPSQPNSNDMAVPSQSDNSDIAEHGKGKESKQEKKQESKEDKEAAVDLDDNHIESDPEDNEAYKGLHLIANTFTRLSGKLMMSTADIDVAKELMKDEIPVDVIVEGVEVSFKNYKSKHKADRINTMKYCEGPVRSLWEAKKAEKGVVSSGSGKGYSGEDTSNYKYTEDKWSIPTD